MASDAEQKISDQVLTNDAFGGFPEDSRDTTTREFCQRCHRVSPIGFHALDEIWKLVTEPGHWQHDILCILCFAQLGDEKHIEWEQGIEFYPVSYATHHARRAS